MSDLPVDIDATYANDAGDASVELHQQHHDALHALYNDILGATPAGASIIPITDTNDRYTATEVESALDEVKALADTNASDIGNKADASHSHTEYMTTTGGGKEVYSSPSSAAGVLTLDLTNGNKFFTTLAENVSSLVFSGATASRLCTWVVKFSQDATGGRTVDFSAVDQWDAGAAPTIPSGANESLTLVFESTDGGTTIVGFAPVDTSTFIETTNNPSDLTPDAPTSQSGTTYTITATDHGKVIRLTDASQVTVTIPTDASEDLADGFEVLLFAEGAGGVTLSTTGITLVGSSPNKTIAQNEGLFLKKTATANTWIILGGTAA